MIQLDRTPKEQSEAGLDLANDVAGDTALSIERERDLRYLHLSNAIQARLDEEDRSNTLRGWILLFLIGASAGVMVGMVWALLIWAGALH